MKRRDFLSSLPLGAMACARAASSPRATMSSAAATACNSCVSSVRGPVQPEDLGITLMHEHVLVDFIGALGVSPGRYDADEVFRIALPHLQAAKASGCQTLVECTPAYLGRDPALLRRLSEAADLNLLTNTGYYGAAGGKHLPSHAHAETADQLAARWTAEHRDGIEGTAIRPGFLKIGVNAGRLSEVDRKLIVAAARCHAATGLTICVHTGNGEAALDILAVLRQERVSPEAYVWVHAQSEPDRSVHLRAADEGAWVELDGVSPNALELHVEAVTDLIRRGHETRLLVSQDAGWYHVGEPGGGSYRGYTFLFDSFLPALRARGLNDDQVRRLLVDNPAAALRPRVRRLTS